MCYSGLLIGTFLPYPVDRPGTPNLYITCPPKSIHDHQPYKINFFLGMVMVLLGLSGEKQVFFEELISSETKFLGNKKTPPLGGVRFS
jgi:hypothetical protein